MFGTSEVHAESVGSMLKRYAKSFSTGRVVESTMLWQHGLKGCGGGSEDAFIEVCWAHFFGSADASKFTFQYHNSKKCAVKYAERVAPRLWKAISNKSMTVFIGRSGICFVSQRTLMWGLV